MLSSLLTKGARSAVQRPQKLAIQNVSKYFLSDSAASSPPSVNDALVSLTIVDPSGARRSIKGFIGKSLYEACDMNGVDLGFGVAGGPPELKRSETWHEPQFGEGVNAGFDHVVLVGEGAKYAERVTRVEEQMLDDYWDFDEIYENSRIASAVTLTKEMDGMVVYVPDRIVDDIH